MKLYESDYRTHWHGNSISLKNLWWNYDTELDYLKRDTADNNEKFTYSNCFHYPDCPLVNSISCSLRSTDTLRHAACH